MKIARKFIFLLVLQFSIILCTLFFLGILFLIRTGYLMNALEEEKIMNKEGSFLALYINFDDSNITVNKKLLRMIDKEQGFMQIVNKTGKVLYSYHTPKELPTAYSVHDMDLYNQQQITKNYHVMNWSHKEISKKEYLILYGEPKISYQLVEQLKQQMTYDKEAFASKQTQQLLLEKKAWGQVIDSNGKIIANFHGPKKTNTVYTLTEFSKLQPPQKNNDISTYFDPKTKHTLMIGRNSQLKDIEEETANIMISGFKWFFIILMIFLVLITILYTRKLSIPLIHIMNWLQQIAGGTYDEPTNQKRRPKSQTASGKLKRPFKLYRDVIESLQVLSTTLKNNEEERIRNQKLRDEWISGLSHDLKTPLSSISGYAHMLEAKDYQWTTEETREFGKIIRDKSAYMNKLIEDLNITYQLNSEALPLHKQATEINNFIRNAVIDLHNHPDYQDRHIQFLSSEKPIYVSFDPKWFQRIIDNIVINSLKHNPPETKLEIFVKEDETHCIVVFADDGIGMDVKTQEQLFSRYYRATNTSEEIEGTGLGMAITKQLVLAHNGIIELESEVHKGTTIRIKLPIS